ncbi:MAG TPA: hypothetical protein PKY96_07650 [Flavobacteriales bacterium]|nr:hypothetical protein [Flavobacteriales bacterium]
MRHLLITVLFALASSFALGQTVHDYASIEFSPGIRKLGVFGTGIPAKVIDLKAVNMSKRDLDINNFFQEVQELEKQGWEVTGQDVVALDKGVHMYVWTLRRLKVVTP